MQLKPVVGIVEKQVRFVVEIRCGLLLNRLVNIGGRKPGRMNVSVNISTRVPL